jgi:hypothetical protein
MTKLRGFRRTTSVRDFARAPARVLRGNPAQCLPRRETAQLPAHLCPGVPVTSRAGL